METEYKLLILYLAVLSAQILFLVFSARKHSLWKWGLLYLFEVGSAVAAFAAMGYYNGLPGNGMMPGLTYFGESLFSMFAGCAYFAVLVISCIVNVITLIRRKKQ